MMDIYDVLDQIVALLQRRGRVTYNALKLQFTLDDDQLAVLTDELLYAHPQVVEDAGCGLRWTGDPTSTQVYLFTSPRMNLLRLVPFSRMISARSMNSGRLIISAPPSPQT